MDYLKAKMLLVVTAVIFSGCLLLGTDGFTDSSTAEVKDRVLRDEYYKRIDNLCMSIPLPDDAKVLGSQGLWNSKGIQYYFKTEAKMDEMLLKIKRYLEARNWVRSHRQFYSTVDYNNGIDAITIEPNPGKTSDLAIFCGKYDAANDNLK